MQFASAIVPEANPKAAAETLSKQVLRELGGKPADLAFLFVSSLYEADWDELLDGLFHHLGKKVLIGCSGGGIIGPDKELEFTPAMSLVAAHLPGVQVHPFLITPKDLQGEEGEPLEQPPEFWIDRIGVRPEDEPIIVLLPNPFSCDVLSLLGEINRAYPKAPVIGGLASTTTQEEDPLLLFDTHVLGSGAVGVALTGNIKLETIVAQGCRPIGDSYVVTEAEENIIYQLGGKPSVEVLEQMYASLPQKDQELARQALFVGVVMNEYQSRFGRGDFLIRNLLGMDPEQNALAVGDRVEIGQTIQFHVRDADSSREDLEESLNQHKESIKQGPPQGGLIFSCMGRGRGLYGEAHYDIRTVRTAVGSVPLGGFFCNGEIGPVAGRNYVHGYTSSIGLFRPKTASDS
ncbi:MAG: FIST C-terminal domain-containing protein [Candidatus Omnitrophica bacterium]|nr:FIST C-terminal domain-containing protein [Candidatus Omnitrophota bacterium]